MLVQKLSQPNVSSLTNRWGIHRILVSFRKWPKTLSWTYFTRVFLISVLCQTVFLIRSFLLFFQNDVAIFLSGSLWLGYSFSWQDHQDNLLIWVISPFAWFSMPSFQKQIENRYYNSMGFWFNIRNINQFILTKVLHFFFNFLGQNNCDRKDKPYYLIIYRSNCNVRRLTQLYKGFFWFTGYFGV